MCLRAIIIALLCFVQEDSIVDILKEILPSRLFHYEQEDKKIKISGHYLVALKQHVRRTVEEELRDDFRSKLLDTIDGQIHRVSNATREELLKCQYVDSNLIAGFLDWALTPISTRKSPIYYTRSLRVWSLALVLAELGFDIEAVRTAMKEPYDEENGANNNACGYGTTAEVELVLSSGWPTDSGLMFSKACSGQTKPPPRIISIRAYPAISYADYVHYIKDEERQPCDAQSLETAFITTFIESRSVFSAMPTIQRLANVKALGLLITHEENVPNELLDQYIKQYIRSDNDRLAVISKVVLPPMQRYLIPWCGGMDLASMIISDRVEWMARTICWAILLSVLSLFVRSTDSNAIEAQLDMEFVYAETYGVKATTELLSSLSDLDESPLGLNDGTARWWSRFVVQVCS